MVLRQVKNWQNWKMQGCFMQFLRLLFVEKLQLQPQAPTFQLTFLFLIPMPVSAFWSIFHSRPVHSLMLSSHRFLCLPLRLPPWTVPCRIVLASPDDRVTCPYHFSFRLFTEVRRSSYSPMAFPILAFTSSLVMWSLYEIPRSLRKHLISNACILALTPWSLALSREPIENWFWSIWISYGSV